MTQVCLSQLCRHAVDLARGKSVQMSAEEREAFAALADLGYIRFQAQPHSESMMLCTCTHAALFEFHFYYRWLPEHHRRFRPQRLRER